MVHVIERTPGAAQAQPQTSETQTLSTKNERGIVLPAALVTLLIAIGMWATLNLNEDRGTQPATGETPAAVPVPEAVMAEELAFETPEFGATEAAPGQVPAAVEVPEPPVVTGTPGAQ